MFPIRDDQPRYSTPYINGFLIGLNIFIFLLQWLQMVEIRAWQMSRLGSLGWCPLTW